MTRVRVSRSGNSANARRCEKFVCARSRRPEKFCRNFPFSFSLHSCCVLRLHSALRIRHTHRIHTRKCVWRATTTTRSSINSTHVHTGHNTTFIDLARTHVHTRTHVVALCTPSVENGNTPRQHHTAATARRMAPTWPDPEMNWSMFAYSRRACVCAALAQLHKRHRM